MKLKRVRLTKAVVAGYGNGHAHGFVPPQKQSVVIRTGRSAAGGRKPGAGRKKGVPNKITTELKELILGALDDVGGRAYLAKQAKANPAPFMTLLGKILPLQVTGSNGGPLATNNTIIILPTGRSAKEYIEQQTMAPLIEGSSGQR